MPDNTNHALALAFGVLILFIVVAGTLWITLDLHGLMPAAGTMDGAGHHH